jgi:hypothetical protein
MRKHFWWICCVFLMLCVTAISWAPAEGKKVAATTTTIPTETHSAKELFNEYVNTVYQASSLNQSGLSQQVFEKALTGFFNLKAANKLSKNSGIITVVDFTKSSREKRMWIIDVLNKKLLLNTWVAHGRGSGGDLADHFSNTNESHQSSLGFYVTDDVYFGKHGRSLRLDGVDEGFNTAARNRAIVVHAADYVSQGAIAQLGRLGRSHGCPAVSPEVSDMVINTIKGKTLLFINGNDANYTSKYLNDAFESDFMLNMASTGTTDSSPKI